MKIPRLPHSWSVSFQQAADIQRQLASKVKSPPLKRKIQFIAGVDSAFSPDEEFCIAGITLWDVKKNKVVEQTWAKEKLRFPYVPGFLSFREAPAIIKAFRNLKKKPDGIMCDGHGIAHPRRFGIASHIGVLLNIPTWGCAKSRLVGRHDQPQRKRGAKVKLEYKKDIVGSVLRTRDGVHPIYVSVGHLLSLSDAEKLTLQCGQGYRLPEPTRLSDKLVAEVKKSFSSSFPRKRESRS